MQSNNWSFSNHEGVNLEYKQSSDYSGRYSAIRSDCFLINVDQVVRAATNLRVVCLTHPAPSSYFSRSEHHTRKRLVLSVLYRVSSISIHPRLQDTYLITLGHFVQQNFIKLYHNFCKIFLSNFLKILQIFKRFRFSKLITINILTKI